MKLGVRQAGVVEMDGLELYQRERQLRSYRLGAVAKLELENRNKIEVAYSEINSLSATPEGRSVLAMYCMNDAELPQEIMKKRLMLSNGIQYAMVSGIKSYETRMESYPLRRRVGLVIMLLAAISSLLDREGKYGGATVKKPVLGFFDDPVATEDFASLYPSIMAANNLSYDTMLTLDMIQRWNLVEGTHFKWFQVPVFVKLPQGSQPAWRVEWRRLEGDTRAIILPEYYEGFMRYMVLDLMRQRAHVRKEIIPKIPKTDKLRTYLTTTHLTFSHLRAIANTDKPEEWANKAIEQNQKAFFMKHFYFKLMIRNVMQHIKV